jgi:AcrR family transcriptional regulator
VGRISAKDRLLSSAGELFYTHGISATGIDKITAHAGVAKMSLYNNFPSKADLVSTYIQQRIDRWQEQYADRLAVAVDGQERLLALFDSYVDHAALSCSWGFRGCGLLNAAAELPVGDQARALVVWQKEEVERLFRQQLSDMQILPELVDETAAHLTYLLEGAMVLAGLDGDDRRLKAARKIALSVLQKL